METAIEPARAGHGPHGHHDDDHGQESHCAPAVAIHVNNEKVLLHRGLYAVATLKKLSGVPLADDLDELVGTKLKPIPDDGTVHIEGCEIFISHVKDGGSS